MLGRLKSRKKRNKVRFEESSSTSPTSCDSQGSLSTSVLSNEKKGNNKISANEKAFRTARSATTDMTWPKEKSWTKGVNGGRDSQKGGRAEQSRRRRSASVPKWMMEGELGGRASSTGKWSNSSAGFRRGRTSVIGTDWMDVATAARERIQREKQEEERIASSEYSKYVTRKGLSDQECVDLMFKTASECSAENGETVSMADVWQSLIAIENRF